MLPPIDVYYEDDASRIQSNRHPHIPISDDRDLRPPDPPDGMDVDLSDERELTPLGKPVMEEYMPPKMRKKLRSRLLEDLRTNGREETPVIVIDGDGIPVPGTFLTPFLIVSTLIASRLDTGRLQPCAICFTVDILRPALAHYARPDTRGPDLHALLSANASRES